jgi:hypothetical protein
MSHFTRIRTRMVEREFLLAALRDLGYVPEEGPVEARGYNGIRTRVQIKVPTRQPGYDIGFRQTDDGYEVVADWYGIRGVEQKDFVQRLHQRYAYHAARARLQEQGFNLVSEENQADGRVHLVLRRLA